MTWYDEIIIDHNVNEALELAKYTDIPASLLDVIMDGSPNEWEVSDEE